MTIAFRSDSLTGYGSHTETDIDPPAGIVDGDLLLLILAIGCPDPGTPATPTPPAGFTAATGMPSTQDAQGFTIHLHVWWKIAASESGVYVVAHDTQSTQGYMMAISGAHQTTPLSPNPTKNTGTGSTTTALGLTTPVDNSLVVFVSQDWANSANTLSEPTGTTPTFTKRSSGTLFLIATGVLATAGATGDKTATNNAGVGGWQGLLISVRPPAAAGNTYNDGTDETASAVDSAILLQALTPASDISNAGSFTASTGSDLYAMLTTRGSGNYIVSPNNPSGAVCEIKASAGDALNDTSIGFVPVDAIAIGGTVNLTVALMQGATEIAARTFAIDTDGATVTVALTAAEVATISDDTDLRWRFTASVA